MSAPDLSAMRASGAVDGFIRRCAAPLRAYVEASSLHALGDADGFVQGFLAARLGSEVDRADRADKADRADHALPLRRRLVNELLEHARERVRAMRADAGACAGCACAGPCDPVAAIGLEPRAFERFERSWARATIGEAAEAAERELAAEGDSGAWQAFRRNFHEGRDFAEIAAELGVDTGEARMRARRAGERLDRALRRLVEDEGFAPDDVDDEIAWMLEVSRR